MPTPPSSKPSGFGTGNSFSKDKLSKAMGSQGLRDNTVKKIIGDKVRGMGTGSSISSGTKEDLAKRINAAKEKGEISSYTAEKAKGFIRKIGQ